MPGEVTYGPNPYSPETPYYIPTPEEEVAPDYERRAVEAINDLCQRDEERARERYRGLLGRIRQWFNREGQRRQAETLDQVGEWIKNPKWKKWTKIGLKIAGGFGIAAAMTFTGGVGAVLTPILWTAGVREGWDGVLQTVEELGWGRKRSKAELDVQGSLTEKINQLKSTIRERGRELTEEEFQKTLNEMLEADSQVMERQQLNMKSEHKWATGRAIASTVLTIGTGLFTGVPLGTHDYDKVGGPHRVFWNWRGGQFLYNVPGERALAEQIAREGIEKLTLYYESFGRASHILGHGLPWAEKIGLIGSGGYLIGRWLEQYIPRRGCPRPPYVPPSYYPPYEPSPYTPYQPPPYGPEGPVSYDLGPFSEDEVTNLIAELKNISDPEQRTRRLAYAIYEKRMEQGFQGDDKSDWYRAEDLQKRWFPEIGVGREREEIEKYLNSQSQEYLNELREQNRELTPMRENCRLAICIPVAFSEQPVIYHTLEQYLGQKDKKGNPLSPELFEINLFVNAPSNKKEELKKTVAEIKRFQQDHPEIKVYVVSKLYDQGTIGEFRKYITDLVLLRSSLRGKSSGPLYLVSNDADIEKIDPHYLTSALEFFGKDRRLEMIAGKDDYPEAEYKKYPFLLAARRLWQFVDIIMRHRKYADFLPKTLGRNSFIKAEAYAKAGGYRREVWVAEDLRLAADIARVSGADAVQYKAITLFSSPRRDIDAIEQGKPIVRSYDQFGMEEPLREKRGKKIEIEKLTLDNPQFQKRLELEASAIFKDIWDRFFWPAFDRHPEVMARRREKGRDVNVDDLREKLRKDPQIGGEAYRKAGRVFRKAMGFWGAKYKLYQDQYGRVNVKITDWSRLREGLERKTK